MKPIFDAEKFLRKARGESLRREPVKYRSPMAKYTGTGKQLGYFTTAETAKLLNVSAIKFRNLRSWGTLVDIPHIRAGNGAFYYEMDAVLDMAKKGKSLLKRGGPVIERKRNQNRTYEPTNADSLLPDDVMGLQEFSALIGVSKKYASRLLNERKVIPFEYVIGRVAVKRSDVAAYLEQRKKDMAALMQVRTERLQKGRLKWVQSLEK